jgi:hypothetical protein
LVDEPDEMSCPENDDPVEVEVGNQEELIEQIDLEERLSEATRTDEAEE